jgi:signal transduction histidine kinase/DNA-binding response OmpR family regulator
MKERLHVFVVEDDEASILLMRRVLERAGHQVTTCRTAADALIVLGNSRFDLMLLDNRLPDMTGAELLQAMDVERLSLPVLMVTGYGDEELAARVLRSGALDYLVKDIGQNFLRELPKRVTEAYTRHRLQQTNRLLSEALESAQDGVMITDLAGKIIHVNYALEKMTGYERPELLGRNIADFGLPIAELGFRISADAGDGESEAGGAERDGPSAESGARSVERETQRRREEAPDAPRLTLQAPRSTLRAPHPPIVAADGVLRPRLSATREGVRWRGWQGEFTNSRKDGTTYSVSVSVSPLVDSRGRLTHFVAIQRDVSSVKQLQQQLLQAQKMQSVGNLAGGVAHEFNNILAGICGYAALGLKENASGPLREFFQYIADLGERAAKLTRQLLTFARRPALVRQPVQLEELVRSSLGLLTPTIRNELHLEVEPNGDQLLVEVDSNQLQQALLNLAINAHDAMTENGVITFRVRHQLLTDNCQAHPELIPPGDYAVVDVADTGSGMTPEVLSQALDPFFTTKEVGKGTGLGLPLVYGIVRGHHGYVDIQTRPGAGTRVSLYLPRLAPAELQPDSAERLVIPELQEAGPPRRILVIDDEPAVRQVVQRFLEVAGHKVAAASSAADAFEQHRDALDAAELIVQDWLIPKEDGAQTFQRLQELRPGLPVIILSGYLHDELASRLLAQGVADVIRKPFHMTELWSSINRVLAGPVAAATDGS